MILDELVATTRRNMRKRQQLIPLEALKLQVDKLNIIRVFPFEQALRAPHMSIIAEIKQASPSKGQIIPAWDFDYLSIAKDYEAAQVDLISVLTEEAYFKGSLAILTSVSQSVATPVLRKDFTIDEYMIYEAKMAGASVILLIAVILDDDQLRAYLDLADKLGLSVIVETHNENEIARAIAAHAKIIGVNNRNLKDFTVDFNHTQRLRALIPKDVLFIAESGIKTRHDVEQLELVHVNGILVGETLMRANDKIAKIRSLFQG